MEKKSHKKLIILVVILAILVVVTRGFSYAKYISNEVFNYYLSSKGFYFESTELTFDTKKHVNTMWDGNKISFSLLNSKNDLLASEVDITYKVECKINGDSENKKCILNGTDKDIIEAVISSSFGCRNHSEDGVNVSGYDEVTCKNGGYSYEAIPHSSEIYFEIIGLNDNEVLNADVTITATSTKPYEKVLSANYVLTKDSNIVGGLLYEYKENDVNSKLIVTNSYNEDKCLKLSFDTSKYLIDNTVLEGVKYSTDANNNINEIFFNLSKMNSTSFTFYVKDNDVVYNDIDFSLIESDVCN